MKLKVYKYNRYEKQFPILYNKEKQIILRFLPSGTQIEHMGSTAVPGLSGKGIIDIMIASPKKQFDLIRANLKLIGYEERSSSDKNRIFLKKEIKIAKKIRRFHVHITSLKSKIWKNAIAFRDYLVAHPQIAKRYALLKENAIKRCKNDGEVYRILKCNFIKKHTALAIKRHI